MQALLEARQITKKFSGVTALHNVDLQLEKGRVTALIGENGAGKSTLLKIMSGIHTDYTGQIYYKERPVQFHSPKDAQDLIRTSALIAFSSRVPQWSTRDDGRSIPGVWEREVS